jgi:hypothetical protein
VLTVFATLAPGCRQDVGSEFVISVRDSDGVAVAENRGPAPAEGPWALAPDPDVVIGVAEGPPEYELWNVVGARHLSDGRLAVVNGGTLEVGEYYLLALVRDDMEVEYLHRYRLTRPAREGG